MTVSGRSPQKKLREDTVTPMKVLSLYADPIWPLLSGNGKATGQGCRVFMHPAVFLGHYTHHVPWNYRDCQVANSERCLT
jgi:hypothetical protein